MTAESSAVRRGPERASDRAAAGYRYSAPPFIKLSCAVHVLSAGALTVEPSFWPWLIGTLGLNHAVIGAVGLLPRSHWLGTNWTRLPQASARRGEVAITLDDGPDRELTPRVLDLLDRHGATASFFVIAERAAQYPELIRAIVERGHSVENHSFRHSPGFAFYGLRRCHAEIERAQQAIAAVTGVAPRFFRPPLGFRSPLVYPVLARLGLTHVSWTRRGFDAVARQAHAVVARLTRGLRAGDILMLHDGHHAGPARRAVALEALPEVLGRISALGLKGVSLPHAARA